MYDILGSMNIDERLQKANKKTAWLISKTGIPRHIAYNIMSGISKASPAHIELMRRVFPDLTYEEALAPYLKKHASKINKEVKSLAPRKRARSPEWVGV